MHIPFFHYRDKRAIIERIFMLFVIPVILISIGVVPDGGRFVVLAGVFLATLWIVVHEHWSYKTLGIRADNITHSVFPYTLFTIVMVVLLIGLAFILGKSPDAQWYLNPHLIFLFIPISLVQEFLYRSFLMQELTLLHLRSFYLIIINTLLFAFLHIIYASPLIIIPITFFAGLGFAWMFRRYPNFYLIGTSHAVLNFVAVLYNFF